MAVPLIPLGPKALAILFPARPLAQPTPAQLVEAVYGITPMYGGVKEIMLRIKLKG